jgi:hypothetical protein
LPRYRYCYYYCYLYCHPHYRQHPRCSCCITSVSASLLPGLASAEPSIITMHMSLQ